MQVNRTHNRCGTARKADTITYGCCVVGKGLSSTAGPFRPVVGDQGSSRSKLTNFRSWEAQSGTLIIDTVDDSGVTYRIVDARMRPRDIATKGTFLLNTTGKLAP